MRGRVLPEGHHQFVAGGIAALNPRLFMDFSLREKELAVGRFQISDFSHQRAARSCRGAWKGARDARMCASHVRKIKEGASESMNPLFIG